MLLLSLFQSYRFFWQINYIYIHMSNTLLFWWRPNLQEPPGCIYLLTLKSFSHVFQTMVTYGATTACSALSLALYVICIIHSSHLLPVFDGLLPSPLVSFVLLCFYFVWTSAAVIPGPLRFLWFWLPGLLDWWLRVWLWWNFWTFAELLLKSDY